MLRIATKRGARSRMGGPWGDGPAGGAGVGSVPEMSW